MIRLQSTHTAPNVACQRVYHTTNAIHTVSGSEGQLGLAKDWINSAKNSNSVKVHAFRFFSLAAFVTGPDLILLSRPNVRLLLQGQKQVQIPQKIDLLKVKNGHFVFFEAPPAPCCAGARSCLRCLWRFPLSMRHVVRLRLHVGTGLSTTVRAELGFMHNVTQIILATYIDHS